MKRKLLLFSLTSLLFVSCDKDDDLGPDNERTIEVASLPGEIRNYISTHFAELTIVKAIADKERNKIEYDVYLSNQINLEFDSYFYVTGINGVSKLPDSVIPEAILNYTSLTYPDQYITDWDWEDTYQQIQLNNSLELVFATTGEFIRIDNH